MRLAFRFQTCVFSSEIDDAARKMYLENFGELPSGDIMAFEPEAIPDHDILCAGTPCPSFSIAGRRAGFNDPRGELTLRTLDIIETKRPRAVLLENVKNLVTHDDGRTLAEITGRLRASGYTVHHRVFNALDWGLRQHRQRIFIVGLLGETSWVWPWFKRSFPRQTLDDVIEPTANLDPTLRLSARAVVRHADAVVRSGLPLPVMTHENFAKHVSVKTYSMALRAKGSANAISMNGQRRPSPRELLRLQGFPDDYRIVVPDSHVRRLAGNSLPVPIARQIAKHMVSALWFQKLGNA